MKAPPSHKEEHPDPQLNEQNKNSCPEGAQGHTCGSRSSPTSSTPGARSYSTACAFLPLFTSPPLSLSEPPRNDGGCTWRAAGPSPPRRRRGRRGRGGRTAAAPSAAAAEAAAERPLLLPWCGGGGGGGGGRAAGRGARRSTRRTLKGLRTARRRCGSLRPFPLQLFWGLAQPSCWQGGGSTPQGKDRVKSQRRKSA